MRKLKQTFVLLILSAVVISCGKEKEFISPKKMDLTEAVYASGEIRPSKEYKVYSTVNGLLRNEFITEGDSVYPGTVLFEIESDIAEQRTSGALASLQLAELNAAGNSPVIAQLESNVARMKFSKESDSITYFRYKRLYDQNAASKVQLEQTELKYKNSVKGYGEAIQNMRLTRKQMESQLRNARSNFNISQEQQNQYLVHSIMAGKVFAIYKEPGELINTMEPLALVGDHENFIAKISIDELDIGRVRIGQKVVYTIDAFPDKIYEGKVEKIYPILDQRTQTVMIDASFETRPDVLYPGLTIEANIVIKKRKNVMVIPRSYVLPGDSVITGEETKAKVKTGSMDLEYVEIVEGLNMNSQLYKE